MIGGYLALHPTQFMRRKAGERAGVEHGLLRIHSDYLVKTDDSG
jgi:hypothetical protein